MQLDNAAGSFVQSAAGSGSDSSASGPSSMRQLRFSARDVAGSELHFGLERGLALRRDTANRRQHHAPRRGQRRLHLQASVCVLSHRSLAWPAPRVQRRWRLQPAAVHWPWPASSAPCARCGWPLTGEHRCQRVSSQSRDQYGARVGADILGLEQVPPAQRIAAASNAANTAANGSQRRRPQRQHHGHSQR